MITQEEIKDMLGLEHWNPHWPEYETIGKSTVEVIIGQLPMIPEDPENFRCFEKALDTMNVVLREDLGKRVAFGWVEGTEFQGVEASHVVNFFVDSDGLWFVDRETKIFWRPDLGNTDKIFWAVM